MTITPRGNVVRSSNSKLGYAKVGEPQFEIAAWCPDEKAEKPPEQVHFMVHLPAQLQLPPLIIRFKSPDTLGFFIEELIRYRREVWKNSELVTGEIPTQICAPQYHAMLDNAGDRYCRMCGEKL